MGYCYTLLGTCRPSGYLKGKGGGYNGKNGSECCKKGKMYPQYRCSPPITSQSTKAHMTINSFEEGGDGGAASECDDKFHSDSEMVMALSMGYMVQPWKSMPEEHQDQCQRSISAGQVWKALKIPKSKIGDFYITWSAA
ncbi:hypothetical protein AAC387_Pa02g3142 [Persea americana]